MSAKAIVFQPQFKWKDGSITEQGTGCFIRAPSGKIIGLTSAHFINFSGPQLVEVDWLDIKTQKSIASSVKSWGMPGREGSYEPLDLSSDYFLLLAEGDIGAQSILEMDNRSEIAVGERIWFPNKDSSAKEGCTLIEGKVKKATKRYLIVKLDKKVELRSRSGTPIISQSTGKIIGILTGCDDTDKTVLHIAPGFSIYRALLDAQQSLFLQDVVGKS